MFQHISTPEDLDRILSITKPSQESSGSFDPRFDLVLVGEFQFSICSDLAVAQSAATTVYPSLPRHQSPEIASATRLVITTGHLIRLSSCLAWFAERLMLWTSSFP